MRNILPEVTRRVITYGFGPDADIRAHDIHQEGVRNHFRVSRRDQESWLEVTLNLPGRHNVLNSLAAIAVAHDCGDDDAAICRGLEGFKGVGRRFQLAGEIDTAHGRVLLVDDYGHHPREVAAVFQAARAAWPDELPAHGSAVPALLGTALRPVVDNGFVRERTVAITSDQPLGAKPGSPWPVHLR